MTPERTKVVLVFRLGPLVFVAIGLIIIVVGNSLARVIGVVILVAWLALVARWVAHRRA
jgi:hypothetical protein